MRDPSATPHELVEPGPRIQPATEHVVRQALPHVLQRRKDLLGRPILRHDDLAVVAQVRQLDPPTGEAVTDVSVGASELVGPEQHERIVPPTSQETP